MSNIEVEPTSTFDMQAWIFNINLSREPAGR